MDDLLRDFLTESGESIALLDANLVNLEKNPKDPELLAEIFRVVHTIKGTCGFLDLPRLEAVAHAGETVLGKIRDGELAVTQQAVSLILESLDCIKVLLAALEQTDAEPAGDDGELIGRLNALAEGASPQQGGGTAVDAISTLVAEDGEDDDAVGTEQEEEMDLPTGAINGDETDIQQPDAAMPEASSGAQG